MGAVVQKFGDWFGDLFHMSWTSAVTFSVTMLAGIWLYGAAAEGILSLGRVPRPLTWWRVHLAQVGIYYPHWLNSVTDWHPPHNSGVVLIALAIVAVLATTARRRAAPGFHILAFIALILSTQWFGFSRTVERYAVMIALLVAVAFVLIPLTHRRRTSNEPRGVYFYFDTIRDGLMYGPVGVILMLILYPILLPVYAVRTLGSDPGKHDTTNAVALFGKELRRLEESPTSLTGLPAADAARLFAMVQVIAASPVMHQQAIDMLSWRPPKDAQSTLPRIGPRITPPSER